MIVLNNLKRYLRFKLSNKYISRYSSVGRAGDCRLSSKSGISRSLVQIRLGGLLFNSRQNWCVGDTDVIYWCKTVLRIFTGGNAYLYVYVCATLKKCAAIAQLGERQTEDLKVPGSIPGRGS